MATLYCNRDDADDILISVTAGMGRVSARSLKLAYRQLMNLRPSPLDSGFPRDASTKTTTCSVTIHGYTSNDGVINAIKSIGFTLAPMVPIDDINVCGLARH